VSLQKPLFDEAEALARRLKIPRSRLFALALEDFVRRHENRELLRKINAACEGMPDASERTLRRRLLRRHRRLLEGEW
jgi:metal-responsive CopG/Arc/MetJ family transcriptional regulator